MTFLRILQTVASLNKHGGGPTVTVTSISRELALLGVGVQLLACAPARKSSPTEVLIPPMELVRTTLVHSGCQPLARLTAAAFRRALLRAVDKERMVVHDNGLWLSTNHAVAVLARQHRLPLIISPRGMLEPWALQHRAFKKRLAWLLYQRRDLLTATVLHATAEQEADNLRKLGLRQPIAVIPNGVELAGFGAGLKRRAKNEAERRDGVGRTALFLSRIHPKKGLLSLIEAWDRLRPAGWRVIIAGPDEAGHRREVEASIQQKGLESAFEFVGAVDGEAKTALYRSAELFVLPTFSENFGVVVAEALSCGVPVITTKGAPWQGLVTHQCGWWIDLGVDPLVEALRQATSASSSELHSMGERGRVYAESAFGWPGIAEQMLSVYRWMLGKGVWPDCLMFN